MSEDWQFVANKIIAKYGYLVMACFREYKIGDIIRISTIVSVSNIEHPWRIIGTSTIEECNEQTKFVGIDYNYRKFPIPIFFYKVVTD